MLRTMNSNAPTVKIIPPLVYVAGIIFGLPIDICIPIKLVPELVAWGLGGRLIICGAVLTGSATLKFKDVGTTLRPDHAPSKLVLADPYK